MNIWMRFKNLPMPLIMLHITAKAIGSFGLGVVLGGALKGYGWWFILAAFLIAIPSTYKLLGGK